MGVFDTLVCKAKLPATALPLPENLLFQTKSLDSWMGYYVIEENGSLWRAKWDNELRTCVSVYKETEFIDVKTIEFHELIDGERWISFKATLENNVVSNIRLVEDNCSSNLYIAKQRIKTDT